VQCPEFEPQYHKKKKTGYKIAKLIKEVKDIIKSIKNGKNKIQVPKSTFPSFKIFCSLEDTVKEIGDTVKQTWRK
jgi:hypothetical protein